MPVRVTGRGAAQQIKFKKLSLATNGKNVRNLQSIKYSKTSDGALIYKYVIHIVKRCAGLTPPPTFDSESTQTKKTTHCKQKKKNFPFW